MRELVLDASESRYGGRAHLEDLERELSRAKVMEPRPFLPTW